MSGLDTLTDEQFERVTVGMPVTRHPPYRPVLALLTHTVPTSDSGVEAFIWVGVQDLDLR